MTEAANRGFVPRTTVEKAAEGEFSWPQTPDGRSAQALHKALVTNHVACALPGGVDQAALKDWVKTWSPKLRESLANRA
jgi:hypothetical protein